MQRLTIFDELENKYDRATIKITNQKLIEKLAEYEDLEEQKRLIKLPCKVYSYLFVPTRNQISIFQVHSFEYTGYDVFINWKICKGITGKFKLNGIYSNRIGVDVFLTFEEAEKKLKEMEDE